MATAAIQLRPVEVGKEVSAASNALQAKQRPGPDASGEVTEGGTMGCEVSFPAGCKGQIITHITLYIYTPNIHFVTVYTLIYLGKLKYGGFQSGSYQPCTVQRGLQGGPTIHTHLGKCSLSVFVDGTWFLYLTNKHTALIY